MLQLGRRRLCRLPSSYVCVSCFASSYSPSITVQRRSVARHHARPLSTTAPCREATAPGASSAAADIKAETAEPSPEPSPPKRKKKKKAPSEKGSRAALAEPKEPLETDAERQLKVLQGALSALKNVLTTRGVDVSQIPTSTPNTSTPTGTPPEETVARAESKPKPKSKPKAKSRPEKGQDKRPKTATTPGASFKKVKNAKVESQVSPKRRASKARASAKPRPLSESKSQSPTKSSKGMSPAARSALAKQMKLLEQSDIKSGEAKPANLGVPFSEMAKRFAGESPSSTKSASAPRKPPVGVNPRKLSLVPIPTSQPDVPSLSYGLERVIFNPGIYHLQDPRSRVYNFDPYLSEIMPVDEFDFNALKQYVTSSKDTTLISIAKEHQKKYTGSTSSMTSMLAHFHFLLSAWRNINVSMLSRSFSPDSMQYTRIMRAPAAVFLHWKDGTYAIDADKEFDTANILSMLGKSMEKLLTLSKDEYERYRHGNSDQITEEERNAEEAFHYTGFQDFMMRSQLDAYDSRVPGTGMFDLKTRAVISIRMDAKGYQKGLGYEIRERFGQWESFEREYYDMIRSAFLKYSLQVRMGRMDGIFVAFHNTQRIFGFQYIPLSEMDLALHGTDSTLLGDSEFKLSLKLLNELLNRATKKWPEQSLRLHFETRTSTGAPFMYVFAKPTTPDEIAAVQNAGKASVEAFEKDILGLVKRAAEDDIESTTEADDINNEELDQAVPSLTEELDSFTAWQEARQMVEEAMDDDELGVGLVREAIGDALEQSGILRARSLAESREYVNALLGALTGRAPSSQADAAAVDLNEEANVDEDELEEQVTAQTEEVPDQTPPSTPLHSEVDRPSALDQGVQTEEGLEGVRPGQKNVEDSAPTPPTEDARETQSCSSQTASTENVPEERLIPTNGHIDNTTTAGSLVNEPREVEEEFEEEDDCEEASEAELENDIEAKESSEDGASSSLEPLKSLIMRMARRIDESPVSVMDVNSSMDDASKLKEFERILGRLISQSRMEKPERESGDDMSDEDQRSESVPPDGAPADNSKSSEIASTPDEITQPAVDKEPQPDQKTEESELLALTLTVKSKVNGAYVDRPSKLRDQDNWNIEYEIQEMEQPRAQRIYEQIKERRRKALYDTGDKDTEWYKMFQGQLEKLTQKGRAFREKESQVSEGRPMYMVGANEPLQWGDVFRRQPKNLEASDEGPNDQQKED
ncbi:mitochondrial protein Pet127-domain-containing protein [Xylaria longipes]|nr:mitochondrial protein Pet127-domain-containing protein [Xylaria longipes]